MHLFDWQNMKIWYWFSGLLGVGVVTCMVNGMKLLGPTYTIAIMMTSQLGFALLIDSFGWLGVNQVPFTFKQLLGVIIIVAGIAVFKFSGRDNKQTELLSR